MKDQVVLVTGAAKRMGRSIALACAKQGARVAIHYGESRAEAEQTAAESGGAPIFAANLESVPAIRDLFARVHAHFGRLDALVNNAARFTKFNPLEIEESDWDYIHSVNLKATFFANQAAARIMFEQPEGGRIVNISSLGAIQPWSEHAHYCASKAGVVMMTRALAKAWAPKISVNTVAPGVIPFGRYDERVQRLIAATPAQREGTGDDIAEAVLFYLTATKFITGQFTAVDGGLSQR